MKVNAMSAPDAIQKMPNGFACNYNINEQTQTVENQQVISYNYDQIRIDNIEYSTIVSAILRQKYSIDKEFALTNNYACEGTSPEWEEYQIDRAQAKAIAKTILGAE